MKLFKRFALGICIIIGSLGIGLLLFSNYSLKRRMLFLHYLYLQREAEAALRTVTDIHRANLDKDLSTVKKKILKELKAKSAGYFIVNEKGVILLAPSNLKDLEGKHIGIDLRGKLASNADPIVFRSPIDGSKLRCILQYFPPLGWFIGSVTSEKEFLRPIYTTQTISITTIALVLILLMATMLILARNIFVIPVQKLTKAVKSVKQGKYEQIDIGQRDDSIGELATSFNELIVAVNTREERLKGLSKLVLELVYEEDEDQFLTKVAKETRKIFNADLVLISLKSPENNKFVVKAADGLNSRDFIGKKLSPCNLPFFNEVLKKAMAVREPVRDDSFGRELKGGSVIAAPLKSGDRMFGSILVVHGNRDSFTRGDLHFLKVFANNVALAYFKSVRYKELKSLTRISKRIRAELDITHILEELEIATKTLFGADAIEVWFEKNGKMEKVFSSHSLCDPSLRASDSKLEEIQHKLRLEMKPIYVEKLCECENHCSAKCISSALFLPLLSGENTVGYMAFYHYGERKYSSDEMEVAQALADQASIALKNSQILERLREHRKQLCILLEIAREFTRGNPLNEILEKALKLSLETLGIEAGLVIAVSEDSAVKAHIGIPSEPVIELLPSQVKDGALPEEFISKIEQSGLKLIYQCPLYSTDVSTRRGVIAFFSSRTESLASEQLNFIGSIAHQLSLGIEAIERTRALRELSKQVVISLIRAVELSDPYTRGHSERVAAYARMIGEAIGLDENELETLEYAALLHDIGKVGVPYVVLLKPGSLAASEWEIIRLHPILSYMVLKDITPLKTAALWVKHHHERFDGTGYPDGLKGAEIPLGSRIIAIADAFDALTTDRPYREKISVKDAKRILREGAGIQWDPDLVKVALKVLKLRESSEKNPLLAELDNLRYCSTITFYRLPVLFSIVSKFWEGATLEDILDNTLREVLRSLRLEKGLIQLIEDGECRIKASFGLSENYIKQLNGLDMDAIQKQLRKGIGTPVCPDRFIGIREPGIFHERRPIEKVKSIVSVPIRLRERGTLLGHIVGISTKERSFTKEEMEFLETVADQLALIIENKQLQELKRDISSDIVRTLIRAVEIKGINLKGHSERVALYAREIGKALGFSEERLDKLYHAGLLHDIGKVVIPDTILAKLDMGVKYLDPEEKKIVELHPVFGATLVEEIAPLKELAPWIRWHSERYDGSGFPDKLKGEQIPLEARILALAEAFDVLTSERGTQRPFTVKKALQKLEETGEKWDPEVLRVAKEVLPKIYRRHPKTKKAPRSPLEGFRKEAFLAMKRLTVLYRIAEELKNLNDLDQFLDKVLEVIQSVSKHHILTLFVKDSEGNLRVAAAKGFPVSPRGIVITKGKGLVGLVAETKESVLVNDTDINERYISPVGMKTGSNLAVPLLLGDELIGVLDVENKEKNAFTSDDLRFYEALSAYLATAVELAMKYEEMESAVLSDRLTGAHTFRSLELKLEELKKDVFTIAFIDLDGLKTINDKYGHPAGDEVLKTLVRVLRENIRRNDMVVRYGGDEFILVLPSTTKAEARNHLESLLRYISKLSILLDDVILPFPGFSYGLATYPMDGTDLQTLIRAADKGLYKAKSSRKPKVRLSRNGEV